MPPDSPNFGPFSSWPEIAAYDTLSERAHKVFDRAVRDNGHCITRPIHHLFLRMAYNAKATSLAVRIANSWCLNLPALALLRVRLEQRIVCSYLIHEDQSLGLDPFVRFMAIGNHLKARAASGEPAIKEHLDIDLEAIEAKAIKAQKELNPGFDSHTDRFQRQWTKLDLHSMAKKRDSLTASKDRLCKIRLETDYVSIYKQASSIVHADCAAISTSFLDVFCSTEGAPVLMAVPTWAVVISTFCSLYDILQSYEILNWLGISDAEQFEAMFDEWKLVEENTCNAHKKAALGGAGT